jgi:endonuclease/exonuclease/phosphatase (EEP) superfamily protein YafD
VSLDLTQNPVMDSRTPGRDFRKVTVTALVVLGWVIVGALAVAALLRLFLRDGSAFLFALDAYTFWLFLPAYLVLIGAAIGRNPRLGAAALVLVLCHVVWVLPSFARPTSIPDAARHAPQFTLLSANLLYTNREPATLARELLAVDADVLDLQEVTADWLDEFRRAGLYERYPYRALEPLPGAGGTAIFSRLPLADVKTIEVVNDRMVSATIQVGVKHVRLLAVHPGSPIYFANYKAQRAAVATYARHAPRPLILAGDFNTTQYNAWLGDVEHLGLRSAHVMLGKGLATTWPNGQRHLPPIRIDHVLVSSGVIPLAIREGRGSGSDHKPVIVKLALT